MYAIEYIDARLTQCYHTACKYSASINSNLNQDTIDKYNAGSTLCYAAMGKLKEVLRTLEDSKYSETKASDALELAQEIFNKLQMSLDFLGLQPVEEN